MEKTIYNLVRNTINWDVGEYFVNSLIEEMSFEEVIELARDEIKRIQYFVRIEEEGWNYWKDKEQRLMKLIIDLEKYK